MSTSQCCHLHFIPKSVPSVHRLPWKLQRQEWQHPYLLVSELHYLLQKKNPPTIIESMSWKGTPSLNPLLSIFFWKFQSGFAILSMILVVRRTTAALVVLFFLLGAMTRKLASYPLNLSDRSTVELFFQYEGSRDGLSVVPCPGWVGWVCLQGVTLFGPCNSTRGRQDYSRIGRRLITQWMTVVGSVVIRVPMLALGDVFVWTSLLC
jgi:hypothetical protein